MYFQADVLKEKSLDDVQKTMFSVLDNMAKNPVTDEEVNRARNGILKYYEQTYNNAERMGTTLSEFIAKGDWRLWFYFRDQVEKVTAADVNRVAAYYLKPSNRTNGLFIPDAKPERVEVTAAPAPKDILKEYKGKAALASAESFDPSVSNIMSRIKSGTLTGGAHYSLLNKTTRGSTVNMVIGIRMGTASTMQNKGVVPELTADMLGRGTNKYTYQQLNDALDQYKANLSVSGSGQDVNISVQTTRENLVKVIGLIEEMLRHPAFPAAEFEKLKEEQLAGIESQKSEPQAIASVVFSRLSNPYPKGDVRYSLNFEEQSEATRKATIEDVKGFYQQFYNGQFATVSVVGDFDEKATLSALSAVLDNWKATVAYEEAKDEFFDVTPKTEKINTPDKKNAMLMCGMNLQLQDNDPDFAALVIGNYILGGGFLNSRLAVRVRQKEGISYGIGSYIQAGQNEKSGLFGSYAIFNPDNLDRLISAYKEELKRITTDGVTETELQDAVKGYLQNRNVSRSQDREMASRMNNYLRWNRTFSWDGDLETRMASLKAADVNNALKKWINPEKISFVEAGDF